MEDRVKYPVGEPNFGELRRGGYVYVDKTSYIPELLWSSKFIFLSRPRRFGKSLLMSTLEAYFNGEKELFDGLSIAYHEKEWIKSPVLHFDMSRSNGQSAEDIRSFLHDRIEYYEYDYGVACNSHIRDVGLRFSNLIQSIFEKYGTRIVILVDEYDNGIINNLDNKEELEKVSTLLRAFFSQPKAMSACLRFCMITGVARFSNYTLFSGPNNFMDISLNPKFASICGITQAELQEYFQKGIAEVGAINGWVYEQTIEALRLRYDSYRFTRSQETVYNPFSLLWAFSEKALDNYWLKSGMSQVFVKYLTETDFDLLELQNLWVSRERMEDIFSSNDFVPLLFQTGYLTIKDYDEGLYLLDIPNGEVRSALVDQLLPHYIDATAHELPIKLRELKRMVNKGQTEEWLKQLQSLISTIPYHLFGHKKEGEKWGADHLESTYHIIVYMLFQMLSLEAHSEINVSGGRIDMMVETEKFIYVMEFKLDGTPEKALAQINEKGYSLPYKRDGREVIKIGIVFNSSLRTISDWLIERDG